MTMNGLWRTNGPFKASDTYLRRMPTHVNALTLAASTAESFTIPSGALYVVFSSEADFWCRRDATASVPTGDVTDGTSAELNPTGYEIFGITSISVISETAQIITAAFYDATAVVA